MGDVKSKDKTAAQVLSEVDAVKDTPDEDNRKLPKLPPPSEARRAYSLTEQPFDLAITSESTIHEIGPDEKRPPTVLYLAYGSNLCHATFQGARGIKPLSAINVVVPELVLTFDLPGLPYAEPCFANTKYTGSDDLRPTPDPRNPPYKNPSWDKGLVGVVYEVTLKDFVHIIATEGGGSAYQDVVVTCYELLPDNDTIPTNPQSDPFKAHTLYAPTYRPATSSKDLTNPIRTTRPDPFYAQPSARYLNLLTSGATEHAIPAEYKIYLTSLTPYTMTTHSQRAGHTTFMNLWRPLIFGVMGLNRMLADKNGRGPTWVRRLQRTLWAAMWMSYDHVFRPIFGDGERTVDDGGVD